MLINDIKTDLAELRIPRWLSPVAPLYKIWMLLAFIIGWFVSRILLIAIYAIVILPMGLAFRLFGRDPLERKVSKDRTSYWIPVSEAERESRYSKKF